MIQYLATNCAYSHVGGIVILTVNTMDERRNRTRQRVLKAGTIEFNRAGGISCLVRNVSAGGACLEVESPLGIPETFNLVILGDKSVHRCKVVWQNAKRIGVAFGQLSA
jgi:hypothetical protein